VEVLGGDQCVDWDFFRDDPNARATELFVLTPLRALYLSFRTGEFLQREFLLTDPSLRIVEWTEQGSRRYRISTQAGGQTEAYTLEAGSDIPIVPSLRRALFRARSSEERRFRWQLRTQWVAIALSALFALAAFVLSLMQLGERVSPLQ